MHCMIKIMYVYDELTLLEDPRDLYLYVCSVRVSHMNIVVAFLEAIYFFHFVLYCT